MLNSLSKDERKIQLLESRLGGTTTRFQGQQENIDLTTSPLPLQNIFPENVTVNTPSTNVDSVLPSSTEIVKIGQDEQIDNEGTNKIIFLDGSSSASNSCGSISNGAKTFPNQKFDLKGSVEQSTTTSGSKRGSKESQHIDKASPPNKKKRSSNVDTASSDFDNVMEVSPGNQDNGSRGAREAQRTIQSYFVPQSSTNSGTQLTDSIFPVALNPPNPTTQTQPSTVSSSSAHYEQSTSHNLALSKSSANLSSAFDVVSKSTTGVVASSSTNKTAASAPSTSSSTTTFTATIASSVQTQLNNTVAELKKQLDSMKVNKEQAESKALRMESELKLCIEKSKGSDERNAKLTKALEDVHRKMAQQEFRRKRDRLALDCVRLGKIVSVRTGPTSMGDVWEEGYALKELNKRSAELLERKEELESRRKKSQNLRRAAKKSSSSTAASTLTSSNATTLSDGVAGEDIIDLDLDLATEIDVIRCHLEQLKRDEILLSEERRTLEGEKAVHQKELKRCHCEERSRFYRDLPALHNQRYLLQSMLGRGGFSEVWKALDLMDIKEVAVKIHQLNPSWSEERKQSYVKHVTREYTIHRDMRHPRVVQLFDVFEIDVNSFATVLEYCRGIDLDEKLKRQKILPEKDARTIFMQIMSGLRYLNKPFAYGNSNSSSSSSSTGSSITSAAASGDIHVVEDDDHGDINNALLTNNNRRRLSVIHYDLKPANILFDEMGDVKITDFGLSKVIDESSEGTSMELTSQGAGTYWYLPPECFSKGNARISPKVDVWSAGIIFYQMLYGSRPYGEGKSQENVWSEGLIFNASQVEFPSDPKAPKVTDEAKDLIRACLTRDHRSRPDVMTVCQHPYLRNK